MTSVWAIMDRDAAHPVATAWRATLREVVKSFVRGDFTLAVGIPGVSISSSTAAQIRGYVEEYGKTLVELSEDTWRTSIAQWMSTHPHWEVLVDLRTVEEGRSDLVLFVDVYEAGGDFRFEIYSVHVP